jgi:hypothetical protein
MGKVVVEQAFVPNREFVVAKPGFVGPTPRPVVEQAFVPNREFVVAKPGFVGPTPRPVVEQAFVNPILLVVVEHPMHWVVDQVGSKNLHLAYLLVGSIQGVEPVVPGVANPKVPQHLLFSSFHYCERVVGLRSELWLLLPGRHPL